jgi:multisubunit Na+/H+ antiporter MnhE subunit
MEQGLMPYRRLMLRIALGVLSWAALLGLWLLFVDSSATPEIVAGLGASVVGAVAADVVRSQRAVHFRPRLRWIVYTWRLPWRIMVDSALVMAALWRRLAMREQVRGALRAVPFPAGGDDPEAAAWRAFAVIATSVAPNTYVIGFDRDRGVALVHQLVPSDPASLEGNVVGAAPHARRAQRNT